MPDSRKFSKLVITRANDSMKRSGGMAGDSPKYRTTVSREKLGKALNESARKTLTRAR